jgi:hypothetical protein
MIIVIPLLLPYCTIIVIFCLIYYLVYQKFNGFPLPKQRTFREYASKLGTHHRPEPRRRRGRLCFLVAGPADMVQFVIELSCISTGILPEDLPNEKLQSLCLAFLATAKHTK